jgi:hypothetical protein
MGKDDKIVEVLMFVFMIAGIVTDSILTSLPLPARSAAVWAFRWW